MDNLDRRKEEALKRIREALLPMNLEELSLLNVYISGLIKSKIWEKTNK